MSELFERARQCINSSLIESLFSSDGAYWDNGEYWTKNPTRSDNNIGSFSINDQGLWHDFAGGESGDLIDILVESKNISKVEAAKLIISQTGNEIPESQNQEYKSTKKVKSKDKHKPITPIPEEKRSTLNIELRKEWVLEKYGKAVKGWTWKDKDGKPLYCTVRHEKIVNGKIKKDVMPWFYSEDDQWHPGQIFDIGRPLLKLNELIELPNNHPIIIVEGEKCSDVVVEGSFLTTWTGGSNAVEKTDWSPLERFTNITIWPDADKQLDKNEKLIQWEKQPGFKAAMAIHRRLPKSKIFDVKHLADKKDGFDIADINIEETKIIDFIKTLKIIQTVNKPDEMEHKGPFYCLGYDDARHWFMRKDTRIPYPIVFGSFNQSKLLELADLSWWQIMNHGTDSNSIRVSTAQDEISSMSRSAGRYNPEKIRGAGVWIDNGRFIVNDGEKIITQDGQQIQYNYFNSKYFYISSSIKFADMIGEDSTIEEGVKLQELFEIQEFLTPAQAMLTMGWSLIASFGGALSWRPHIWLTGKKGSGKSWIMEYLIDKLLGPYAHIGTGNDSEAGIRRSLNLDPRPVRLDEMEPKSQKARDKVISILILARNASSNASQNMTLAACDGPGTQIFKIRSCFCFGSVQVLDDDAAINSRISRVEMKTIKSMKNKIDRSDELRSEIMNDPSIFTRRIFHSLDRIISDIKWMRKEMLKTFGDQRRIDQVAPMIAAAWAVQSDLSIEESQDGKDWLSKYIIDLTKTTDSSNEDEEMVINHILSAHIRINETSDGVKTISELMQIAFNSYNPDAAATLERFGFKVCKHNQINVLAIAAKSDQIRKLLSGTNYQFGYESQIRRHKFSIDDKTHQVRLAGRARVQCYLFEWSSFKEEYLGSDFMDANEITDEEMPF